MSTCIKSKRKLTDGLRVIPQPVPKVNPLDVHLAELLATSAGASDEQGQEGVLDVSMSPVLTFDLGDGGDVPGAEGVCGSGQEDEEDQAREEDRACGRRFERECHFLGVLPSCFILNSSPLVCCVCSLFDMGKGGRRKTVDVDVQGSIASSVAVESQAGRERFPWIGRILDTVYSASVFEVRDFLLFA